VGLSHLLGRLCRSPEECDARAAPRRATAQRGYGGGMAFRGLIMDYAGVLTDGAIMRDLPRRARAAGRPTALVSSAGSVSDEIAALFDVLVLGGAIGVVKPDPEVYRRTAALLGLAPAECVVVDDLAANIRGARAAGAVGVLHDDPDTTIGEVEILLALPD
jgi:putative hydrolase of the HAD superfamily